MAPLAIKANVTWSSKLADASYVTWKLTRFVIIDACTHTYCHGIPIIVSSRCAILAQQV